MADETIFELNSGTAVAPTAASRFIQQQTGATTRATGTTYALMGGLEENAQTPVSSDITGAVGQFYLITQSSQSADINLTLPASANDGERIGVHMVDGDDTYEVILKGAATVTINGGSAATEWSRLFIAGETVIFRCTSSTNWIVEYDGRIPCKAKMYLDTTLTNHFTSSSWITAPFDTSDYDVGNINDIANEQFVLRRAGYYILTALAQTASGGADEHTYTRIVTDPSGTPTAYATTAGGIEFGHTAHGINFAAQLDISTSDIGAVTAKFGIQVQVSSTTADALGASNKQYNWATIMETF